MDNMTLLVDPETKDLVFDENGMLVQIFDEETVIQNVRHALLAWKEEFFADEEHGTDYDRIVGRNQNEIDEDEIEQIIREAVFQEDEVQRIDSLTVAYEKRSLSVELTATIGTGEQTTLALEVEM